jgi:Na+-transporting methylmalonyl-CoA/oxaloacetate decarboxylase gamma subunit
MAWVATTWIEGMTDVLQVILLLATLIWTIVKIAQAIKDLKED